jgi:tetratricopeptide (TPR) repeat protein
MQVLVVLADAAGAVITRDTLLQRCWGGVYVGDDSLNRAISGVRRIASRLAAGSFEIETIPRTGYRLTGSMPEPLPADAGIAEEASAVAEVTALPRVALSRRSLLIGICSVSAGGLGFWAALRDPSNPRAAELLERGRNALRDELPHSDKQGIGYLREAVAIEPDNDAAWGLLALALRNAVEHGSPEQTAEALRESETAARRALEINPREGNALTALATLRPFFGDWIPAEDRLREVLRLAPNTPAAINHFVIFLQSVGRERDSLNWNERALALDPLSPVPQYRRALKYWIYGRVSEADLAIDRALQIWPRHPAVWNVRLMIFAYTGRPRAGLAMLDDEVSRPPTMTAPARAVWKASLVALQTRAAGDIEAARRANTEAATRSPGYALNAMQVLSALGELDAAFAVAEGHFLRQGPLAGTLLTGSGQMPVNDQRWRRTMFLFTPIMAPMQADPRFTTLCRAIGLVDYWQRRGIEPDFLIRRT